MTTYILTFLVFCVAAFALGILRRRARSGHAEKPILAEVAERFLENKERIPSKGKVWKMDYPRGGSSRLMTAHGATKLAARYGGTVRYAGPKVGERDTYHVDTAGNLQR